MNRIRTLACLLCFTALAGCVSLGKSGVDENKTSVYILHPPRFATSTRTTGVIAVMKPEVPVGLRTERIALLFDGGRQLDYYADARWSGRLEVVLQEFVTASLRSLLKGASIEAAETESSAKSQLVMNVTDFAPVYDAAPDKPPRLHLAMTVTLTGTGGKVLFQAPVDRWAKADANTMTAVTRGLEQLLQDATKEVLPKIVPALGVKATTAAASAAP